MVNDIRRKKLINLIQNIPFFYEYLASDNSGNGAGVKEHKFLKDNNIQLSDKDGMNTCIELISIITKMYGLGIAKAFGDTYNFSRYFQNWSYINEALPKVQALYEKNQQLINQDMDDFNIYVQECGLQYNIDQCRQIPIQGTGAIRNALIASHHWWSDIGTECKLENILMTIKDGIKRARKDKYSKGKYSFVAFSNQAYITIPGNFYYDYISQFLIETYSGNVTKLTLKQLQDVRNHLNINPIVTKVNNLIPIYVHIYGSDTFCNKHYSYNEKDEVLRSKHREHMYQYYTKKYPNLKLLNPITKAQSNKLTNKSKNSEATTSNQSKLSRVDLYDKPNSLTSNSNDDTYKFCPKCGSKCIKNANFCMKCGYHFN